MNIKQFAELKVGDAIYNPMSQSRGAVTKVEPMGVNVRWGDGTPGRDVSYYYTVQGTAWFHWERAEDERPVETSNPGQQST